ncbi:MAG: hypothetical protein AAGA80_25690 [Cyanobacteria bacterium P01_F01_bin.143]
MADQKSLLVSVGLGLAILSFGEVTLAQANQSTLTTGISATGSISNSVTNIDFGGITVNGIQSQSQTISIGGEIVPIPQDVFQSLNIETNVGSTNAEPPGGIAAGTERSPEKVVICLTDSCSPGDSSININDLASLVENNLNQALNDLVIAEQAASDGIVATNDSRRIVRRESDVDEYCGCAPGEITISREPSKAEEYISSQQVQTVAEARRIVEIKLEESSLFIEQVNQLKPENSIW